MRALKKGAARVGNKQSKKSIAILAPRDWMLRVVPHARTNLTTSPFGEFAESAGEADGSAASYV
jgi:hypothetical protein